MADIKFEIKESVAVLSETKSGWTKELNMVSWNGNDAKYDLRDWDPDHKKCGKGVTLTKDEAKNLMKCLVEKFSEE